MSGDLEAAGDALTGGVVARAVEPRHGEDGVGADGLTHEHACLNCGATLAGPYCQSCGQQAHVHRTLGAIFHDLAHGVFHFEGKVWRTLPMLGWKPGGLTRRYIHGERARFVSPLALFLFSVFLMFAVFEIVGGPVRFGGRIDATQVRTPDFTKALADERAAIRKLEAERAVALAGGKPTADLDRKLADRRDDERGLEAATTIAGGVSDTIQAPTDVRIDTGSKEFDDRVRAALKNPKLLLYKLQSSAYKFAWALIPLSLPFMWLIFAWRPQYRLYDHAVFVTYSLSFVMLLLIAMALFAAIGVDLTWAFWLVPVHMFVQLRGAYALGWPSALWRTVVLMIVAAVVLLLFGAALLALGLIG